MAGVLNTVYAAVVVLVALGGIGAVMWLTPSDNESGGLTGAIVTTAVAVFLLAMIGTLLV
ncbi:hypothetical protein [Halegenticoccus soli]|uniref:hypothetical protein n=1 Tax=Halegenticoccus soli TaxID=1985678 RepID=UPI000C6E066D|nr:hypothetical protein [Halegenticoccus soli]